MYVHFLRFRYLEPAPTHFMGTVSVSNRPRSVMESSFSAVLPWPIEYVSDIQAVEAWAGVALNISQPELLEWRELKGQWRPGVFPTIGVNLPVMQG